MNEQYRGMIIGGIAGLLLGVLVMMLFGQGDLENVEIGGSETGFSFVLKAKEPKLTRSVFDSIWEDDNFQPVMVDWLRGKDYISLSDDQAIGDRITNLEPNETLAKTILELRALNDGPFEILADSAIISVPDYPVNSGRVNTWSGNPFVGDTIVFSDPEMRSKPIKLYCTDNLGARGRNSKLSRNFFHMSAANYKALLQDRQGSGPAKGMVYFTVQTK